MSGLLPPTAPNGRSEATLLRLLIAELRYQRMADTCPYGHVAGGKEGRDCEACHGTGFVGPPRYE